MPDETIEPQPDRAPDGKFGKGNKAGRGRPGIRKVKRIRDGMIRLATIADIDEICKKGIEDAKVNRMARKQFFDVTIGRPSASAAAQEMEALKTTVKELKALVIDVLGKGKR